MSSLLGGNEMQRLHDLQILEGIRIQQNWIIIRQLNELTKLLAKDKSE